MHPDLCISAQGRINKGCFLLLILWITGMTDHNALHLIFYHRFSGLHQAESVQAGGQMIEGSIQLN